jgi:cyclophilin family peptidyl-prolyl cis-trans isomerase/HEAT repeat protein
MVSAARARRGLAVGALVVALSACASAPPPSVTPPSPPPAIVPLDQKVSWIIRLEQQRMLADTPSSSMPPVPGAAQFEPASRPDLIALARDVDPLVRRRAALAIGRVGMAEGVPALVSALQDPDVDVRASAAFGLGLLGAIEPTDPAAEAKAAAASFPGRPALISALGDAAPQVRGRAIEALGLIGDPSAAGSIASVAANCGPHLAPLAPDDEEWPKAPEIELCRLALFALVRLRDYDALASIVLDGGGRPVSRWWPVAYALQRINDARAAPALAALASGPGVYTVGFALRGLTGLKDPSVATLAGGLATDGAADIKVRIAAVRALGQVKSAAPLRDLLVAPTVPMPLRLEVVAALGAAGDSASFDSILDFAAHPAPAMRRAALTAASTINRDAFLVVLSGLGRDPDWSVRAALAGILATLPADLVTGAIEDLADEDDGRVRAPALEALAAVKAPSLPARLHAALETADFVVRATAARLIGEARLDGSVPRLVAAYARGESDATYTARWAALEALSKYGGDEAIATLRRALGDRDWPVRWRAARLLTRLGQPGAVPARPAPLNRPAEFFASAALLHPPYSPRAVIETGQGAIEVQLNLVDAAVTTHIFMDQAREGFFNGMKIHRLVPTFVVQAGDPRGDGEGGPGYTIRDELSPQPYLRGAMGMALDWRDTGGSQWFLTLSPQPHLDARYTVFGRVVSGMDVLDRLAPGDVIERIRIWDGVTLQ